MFFFIVVANRLALCDFVGSRCHVFLLHDFIGNSTTWNDMHY